MGFCNAGHNPPLLDGEFMKMEANAPIGLWPDLDYEGEEVTDMHGKTLCHSSNNRTVALRAAWAPMTSTCAMSAVFDGPLINVP